jgi:PPK2 family polyphosphate:nucleotide phosphotransferase
MLLAPVPPGTVPALDDKHARPPDDAPRGDALDREMGDLLGQIEHHQSALYAEGERALLVVLQGRDAAGKDGVIRKVFGAFGPQGCQVTSFAAPNAAELAHDYLWRVHVATPPRGRVGIFNRSHYEDVLAVRVRRLVPDARWSKRYDHINEFERMLADEGTTIVKFFLHVSMDEQRERLRKRLTDPEKNWKFRAGDLDDRALWDDYTRAYEDAISRCSTAWAPWYVVPADKKSVRDYLVAQVVVDALARMAPQYPRASPEVLEQLKRIT